MSEAVLGFRVDSSQAVGAASDLDRLTASSGKAEQAANKVSIAATKASRSFGDISPALDRIIAGIDQLNQTSTSISAKLDAMARSATGAARAAKGIGDAANDAGKGVDNLSDKIRKAGDSSRNFGDQASHVKAFRDEIDRLAAKFAPVQTAAQKYQSAIAEIQSAHRLGVISAQQMTAELDKERAAFERLSAAANKMPSGQPRSAANSNANGANRAIATNLMFQGQDIFSTALMGMAPRTVALQQGPQVAGALAGLSAKEAGGALLSAAAGLVSPVSLAAVAITGLTAASIQYFTQGANGAKSLDETLKANADTLDLLKDKYGDLAKVSASITSVAGNSFVLSEARSRQIALNATMRSQIGGFLGSANDSSLTGSVFGTNGLSNVNRLQNLAGDQKQFAEPVKALLASVKGGSTDLDAFNKSVESVYANLAKGSENPESLRGAADAVESLANAAFSVAGKFKPFQDAINLLKIQGVDGLSAFTDQVHQIGEEKGITKLADELISKGGDIVKLAQQAETLRRTLQAIDREDTRPGLRDRDASQGYIARRGVGLRQLNEQFGADQQQQDARTFGERLAAVERVSRSQRPTNADDGGGEDARAGRAVLAEQNRQQRELRDAAVNRSTALQSAIADQQQEISIVGKAGAEQAGLRKEYELTSQIRLEAIKNGVEAEGKFSEVYGKELESIKTLSAEYGRLVETRARAQLSNDLSFQRDQLGRSPEQRRIADQLRGAGLPVDLTSKSAKEIADTNRALASERMGNAREGFNAQITGINARTPAERIAAARAAAAAQHNDNETDPERAQRINDQEAIARAQINRQQADADRERSMSLRRLLEDQQQDIDLIGKTGAAVEAAKEQYQLMSQLRQQAAQQGITSETDFQTVFAKQIEQIKEASAEYGKLVELRGRTQLNSDLDFQSRQMGRSARDQQVVTTLRQYGQPEDLNSPDANRVRQQLRRQEEKTAIDQFSTNLASNIVQSGGKIGKAFAQTFLSSLQESAQKQLTNIFSQLLTSLLMPKTGASAEAGGGIVGLGATAAGRMLSPSSSPASPTTQTGVAAQAWNFFAGKGLQPHQIAGVLGNISAESGFNSKAVGDGGKAFGLFQNHAARGGGSALISSGVDGQLNHAWNELQGPENKAYQALMKSTDVRGATAAFAGFERPRGFSLGNPEGADNFSGRLSAANDALNKFGTTTNQATQGVGALGSGLGQLGASLGSGAAGAATGAGGGGLFGWIGNLFKPDASASSGFNIGSNMVPFKGFATGTNYAPGGPAIVGENGPELMNLPQGSQVTSNHKLMSALAANSNQPQQSNRTMMVNVQGANGDDHVRTLVQQGVGAALSDYNTQQRRGGVGVLQARYSNQKV